MICMLQERRSPDLLLIAYRSRAHALPIPVKIIVISRARSILRRPIRHYRR